MEEISLSKKIVREIVRTGKAEFLDFCGPEFFVEINKDIYKFGINKMYNFLEKVRTSQENLKYIQSNN